MSLSYTKPNFVSRTHKNEAGHVVGKVVDALAIIAYVKTLNPKAKLIPNGRLYNLAVTQFNLNVKNTLTRPPIPEWFCGYVDESSGLLGLTPGADTGVGALDTSGLSTSASMLSSNEYPWDDCVLKTASTPGSFLYINCFDDKDWETNMGEFDFWSEFVIEYDEDARAAMYAGEAGSCSPNCKSSNGYNWCYGGFTPGTLTKAKSWGYKITKATTSRLDSSNTGNWGRAAGHSAEFICCLWLKQDGEFKGGKYDWISQDRSFRGLEHITGHYNGWCEQGLESGQPGMACVVDPKTNEWSGMSSFTFS